MSVNPVSLLIADQHYFTLVREDNNVVYISIFTVLCQSFKMGVGMTLDPNRLQINTVSCIL